MEKTDGNPFKKVKTKFKIVLDKKPQLSFLIMIGLVVISILIVYIRHNHKVNSSKPLNELLQSVPKSNISRMPQKDVIEMGNEYLKLKRIEKSLDSIENKTTLTRDDSLQIRSLLKQIENIVK